MATVRLELTLPATFQDQFVVTWEVLDPDLEVVRRGTFFDERRVTIELGPGRYWARLQLPSGQTMSRAFELKTPADQADVAVDVVIPSRHEWLGWATVSEEPGVTAAAAPSPALEDLWIRAYSRQQSAWVPTDDAANAQLFKDDGLYQIEVHPSHKQLLALQIGGADIPSRFLILPPEGIARVLITATRGEIDRDTAATDPIEVTASLRNSVADHLARFLTVASPSARDGVDASLAATHGLELLSGKRNDPLGAAVGGYLLMQQRESPPPSDWLKNLADWFEWLPDGAILYASCSLASGGRRATTIAIEYLLRAATRGYPVIRLGVGTYLDAVRIMQSSRIELPHEIEEHAALLASVRAADTRQTPFTTFYGAAPDSPSTTRVLRLDPAEMIAVAGAAAEAAVVAASAGVAATGAAVGAASAAAGATVSFVKELILSGDGARSLASRKR